jgi:hypothetical protein
LADKKPEKSIARIQTRLNKLKKTLNFDYVIFHPGRNIATMTVSLEPRQHLFTALHTCYKALSGFPLEKLRPEEELAAGLIFGPQLNLDHLSQGYRKHFFLTWPDSSFKKPLIWARNLKGTLVVVLIDYSELSGTGGIKRFLVNFSEESGSIFGFALLKNNKQLIFTENNEKYHNQIRKAVNNYSSRHSQTIETKDLLIFPNYLRPDVTIIGYIDKSAISVPLNINHVVSLILILIFSFLLIRYAWKVFLLNEPDSLSLRWKLQFLFFFANGLPLLVLFFLGTDYLSQKQDTLLKDNLTRGITFLQNFDESFESEYARILVRKKYAQEHLIRRLKKTGLTEEIMKDFVNDFGDYDKKVLLIASRSSTLGTEKGLYDPKRGIYPKDFKRNSSAKKSQYSFTRKIGQYFIDSINGVKISNKIATEIEILVESVTQKPVVNFIFEMMQRRGNFTQWGFGSNVHPSIIDTFTLGHTKNEDYFFVASFKSEAFQHSFLKRYLAQANRNKIGLRVVALKDRSLTVPPEAWKNIEIRDFATTLTSFPGDEIKIVDFKENKHLIMGFIGNSLTEYNLIGLFPVSKIDRIIKKQKTQLTNFALLSLIITLILSQILARSFLVPLRHLSQGAKAIDDKRFSHRLPEMSHDEFGKMGEIFNEVMVDLDELSVASAIQEQLLPQQSFPTGRYSLYGKSVSMGELGGDYFDFLDLANEHFGVLLGDVAGHGVGAALIMAMAKAGIIQSEHLLNKPVELTTRLHSLIHASKTKKQRKIMTFQYLYLNKNSSKAVYTNAGACSPMIIRKKDNRVEELNLTGAALGAFKKAKFSETTITFEPGDAIIFYTDGIVEARSESGEEIGYDGLKQLLLTSWNKDAQTFYQNIFNCYLNHIGSMGAQDDLTMVILVYSGEDFSLTTKQ